MYPQRVLFTLMLLLPAPAGVPAPDLPGEAAETRGHPSGARAAAPARDTSEGDPPPPEPEARPVPLPTPLGSGPRTKHHLPAYLHAFEILREDNSCSRFFGGPAKALEVLNRFAESLVERRLENPIVAIKMSGPYSNVFDRRTGAKYRLFEETVINTGGPLYTDRPGAPTRNFFGRFRAGSEGAKVLTVLHELGHLVEGPEGDWLLRNDGGDTELSIRNTKVVEGVCIEQLLAIKD